MKRKLRCILLIEDNHLTNIFNEKLIHKLDIAESVHIAENGQEGLDFINRTGKFAGTYPRPDLIFLDINTPVMNGWEFLEEFAGLPEPEREKIVIVMLTTSPNPDDERKAKNFGSVAGYKLKPLSKEVLLEIMENHFGEYM
jgi:CheY-like chemotaxis protein